MYLAARPITGIERFLHRHGPLAHQAFDARKYPTVLQRAGELGHGMHFARLQEFKHLQFLRFELRPLVEVFVHRQGRLTLQAQARRHGGLVDIAQRTHIIIGHPLPQAQLHGQDHGALVEHVDNGLQLEVPGGRLAVLARHDARIEFALAKGHYHPEALADAVGQGFGQEIGEGSLYGNGKYHVAIKHIRKELRSKIFRLPRAAD